MVGRSSRQWGHSQELALVGDHEGGCAQGRGGGGVQSLAHALQITAAFTVQCRRGAGAAGSGNEAGAGMAKDSMTPHSAGARSPSARVPTL